ncbi:MAG: hypothetical protein QNJ63_19610 [Calothrix sp. MO_192.B10]|nr:hypothetical protein [Calothrix sp. MO_192.B10]
MSEGIIQPGNEGFEALPPDYLLLSLTPLTFFPGKITCLLHHSILCVLCVSAVFESVIFGRDRSSLVLEY